MSPRHEGFVHWLVVWYRFVGLISLSCGVWCFGNYPNKDIRLPQKWNIAGFDSAPGRHAPTSSLPSPSPLPSNSRFPFSTVILYSSYANKTDQTPFETKATTHKLSRINPHSTIFVMLRLGRMERSRQAVATNAIILRMLLFRKGAQHQRECRRAVTRELHATKKSIQSSDLHYTFGRS